MPPRTLTGTRIRARRSDLGLKQGALAVKVGISPSYLNLIEHNRRRIGGKLLVDIARALSIEPVALSEGAEAALIDALREAAGEEGGEGAAPASRAAAEIERLEEFAGRFPGWAALLAETHGRLREAERSVEALSDRLSHDPHLSASLHEMLSSVTSIRSTATILAETPDIDREWRDRFHRNINDDSARLAESAEGLVHYLDNSGGDQAGNAGTPQEDLEAWLAGRGYHLEEGEGPKASEAAALAAMRGALKGAAAVEMGESLVRRYVQEAEALPAEALLAAANKEGFHPGRLAARFGLGVDLVFRRLAALPRDRLPGEIGLVACDGSGTLTFRKPIAGFPMPRYGAACALWPLYTALVRPGLPVATRVEMAGRAPRRFSAYAISLAQGAPAFGEPQVYEATMLLLDEGFTPEEAQTGALALGTSCRICPREGCAARREPSIVGG